MSSYTKSLHMTYSRFTPTVYFLPWRSLYYTEMNIRRTNLSDRPKPRMFSIHVGQKCENYAHYDSSDCASSIFRTLLNTVQPQTSDARARLCANWIDNFVFLVERGCCQKPHRAKTNIGTETYYSLADREQLSTVLSLTLYLTAPKNDARI